ncbi:hypothetical protein GQ55_9G340900 [Panicum hallii var. hallii]|uniref:Uncharacterized protein n=1 Tax=Panicum hallii var. hallii TaxID=1504633 RepID=A0A2T7C8G1_9POAL|nr:hypothetical protein GQ55_9G340900 [Panicum hallii var. hallii]
MVQRRLFASGCFSTSQRRPPQQRSHPRLHYEAGTLQCGERPGCRACRHHEALPAGRRGLVLLMVGRAHPTLLQKKICANTSNFF